jgi:hypothetical protein
MKIFPQRKLSMDSTVSSPHLLHTGILYHNYTAHCPLSKTHILLICDLEEMLGSRPSDLMVSIDV